MQIEISNSNFNIKNKIPPIFKSSKLSPQSFQTNHCVSAVPVSFFYPLLNTKLSFGNSVSQSGKFNAEAFMLPDNCLPDQYQINAAKSLSKGNNTVVTAPTGTGKTAIAHFIIKKNFEEGSKTFYTTPLKALSNQKYHDLKKLFGKENVGILTGDRKENVKAPIVIMTTEIYRNIVSSDYLGFKKDMLNGLKTVIFDEFHYMGDPDRGTVWEESIMYTPQEIQILALSATVGNNKKVSSWINSIKTKQSDLVDVPSENRHVPLKFIMFNPLDAKTKSSEHQTHISMKNFVRAYYNSEITEQQIRALNALAVEMGFKPSNRGRKYVIEILRDTYGFDNVTISSVQQFLAEHFNVDKEKSRPLLVAIAEKTVQKAPFAKPGEVIGTTNFSKKNPMDIINLVKVLKQEDKLPAIAFVFSKKYSEELLKIASLSGKDLTTKMEKAEIKKHLDEYKTKYGFYSNNLNEEALLKGYAIHSAAILPLQKQLIEELFNKKLIKVAFATETLAAGINMPARTVIMTDYQKPAGELNREHIKLSYLRPLLPNEFQQMAGRAGRRGIDDIGYVVLLTDTAEKQAQFEKLIAAKPNPISSSLKIDASNVANFHSVLECTDDMKRILDSSFSVFDSPEHLKTMKLNEHMAVFRDYIRLLEKYWFLEKTANGYKTTPSGMLLSEIKGKPQIPIVKAILSNRFSMLNPAELAAAVAAIAAGEIADKTVFPMENGAEEKSRIKQNELNEQIDATLHRDLNFTEEELNSKNTNDEILEAVNRKYSEILCKNLEEIELQRENLLKLLAIEEKEVQSATGARAEDKNKTIAQLRKRTKALKEEKAVIKRTKWLKELLSERLGVMLLEKFTQENNISDTNTESFAQLAKDFSYYNQLTKTMTSKIPEITLNATAFLLVNKWAQANSVSKDYVSNWNYICGLLQDSGSIKYEGDLFNAISQTIDFIQQIESVAAGACKMKISTVDREQYNRLRRNCRAAVKLLKTPPLYNSEEI